MTKEIKKLKYNKYIYPSGKYMKEKEIISQMQFLEPYILNNSVLNAEYIRLQNRLKEITIK